VSLSQEEGEEAIEHIKRFRLPLLAASAFVGIVDLTGLSVCSQEFITNTTTTIYYEDGTTIQYFTNGTELGCYGCAAGDIFAILPA
jgi:hypothetical protein